LASLSIVIPAYNEERRLPCSIDAITAFHRTLPLSFFEVVVVDDGSSDGTAALVERWNASNPCIRLVKNPGNRGKGYSVRHGMLEARGEWILCTDADLSAPIDDFRRLMSAAEESGAAVAIGSRALDRSLIAVHQAVFREYSGRVFNTVVRLFTGLPFRDTQCGFKLFRRDAAREIFRRQQLDGFSFDVENLYIARKLGIRVVEVPVRWSNVEGTKVSTIQGMKSFLDVLRIRAYDVAGRYR
jgi:dolichyl-phosphate beta-glucosyltransferase